MLYYMSCVSHLRCVYFFYRADDGIRVLVRSRGIGVVYKVQQQRHAVGPARYCEAQLSVQLEAVKSRFEAR